MKSITELIDQIKREISKNPYDNPDSAKVKLLEARFSCIISGIEELQKKFNELYDSIIVSNERISALERKKKKD